MCNLHEERNNMAALKPQLSIENQNHGEMWSKCALLLVVLGGAISMFAPGLSNRVLGGFVFMPIGFMALVLVIYLHLSSQRKLLRDVSSALIAARSYVERLEQYSFVDPETQLFNRKYLDHLFNQQSKWLNRSGKSATLLLFEVLQDGQRSSTEEMVVEVGFILRSNFRGSDYVVRYSASQLLVLLPDTNEDQAQFAMNRLTDKLDSWNLENVKSEMVLRQELGTCPPGRNLWAALKEIEETLRNKTDPGLVTLIPAGIKGSSSSSGVIQLR
jgi:diguanylate cyclase (GGDEF)-like protein